LNAIITEWGRIRREIRPAIPGLYLVIAVAIVARFTHGLIPWPPISRAISEVFIAVVLGLHVRAFIGFGKRFEPGIKFALQRILRLGIILLGLRLSLQDVVGTGVSAILLILFCMILALTLAYFLGGAMHIPRRLAVLIGVGTAICGNSAIIATAPVIEAKDEDVSIAVATITFFGTLAVILYPIIGYLLGLSDQMFGMWAGTAILDTSQVVAAGAAFSARALDVATVVKLVRNTLIAPVILAIGIFYARAGARSGANSQNRASDGQAARANLGKSLPWFVVGFMIMVLVRTVGVALGIFPQDVAHPGNLTGAAAFLTAMDNISKFAILMALSAIGLGTDMGAVRRTGIKPVLLGFIVAGCMAVISLTLILFVIPGR
jgi:uncharacterized integral membrane protein (TIGR00698 family)